jgi:glycosyltransferase involved in cell wall biosynthesis
VSGPARVTVVVPVWNGYVKFLADAVESVRRNAPQAPIVVVDNASSTPVPELEACEVVRSPRRLSAGAARNLGLERVATEYVVFLDADDMLLEGTLEYLHGRIAADAGLALFATSILDGGTGERHPMPRHFVMRLVRWSRVFALADSVWSLLPIQACAILRTDRVREAGGYADADNGEDWVLAVSLAWRGRVEVSERLGLYYRSPTGSRRGRGRSSAELRASTRRVRERMRRDPAVPAWARALLPAIATLQLAAIHLARPLYLATRWLRTALRSTSVDFR